MAGGSIRYRLPYQKEHAMQDRNVINATAATIVAPFVDFYARLVPFVVLAIVLIIADSRFGIAAAKKRGETIRPSRKWRRAINKLVDYVCWVTLAGMFGQTFGQVLGIPVMSALILLVIYGIEISSCFSNYFEAKGIAKKVNIFKLIGRSDIGDCIEDTDKKDKHQTHD